LERIDRGIYARSRDIGAWSSWHEILYLTLPRILPFIVLLAMPLIFQLSGELYWAKVMFILAMLSMLAMSWELLRIGGMFCLGQSLFLGLGSYITGGLNGYFGWPISLTIPIATLGGAILGTCILLGTLKLRGLYFAVVTLAIPLLVVRVLQLTGFMGGTQGIETAAFPNYWVAVYLAMIGMLIIFFGLRRLMESDWGLVARAIGQDDIAVSVSGIDVTWRKIQILFIASCIGAFAGALLTHFVMYAGPSSFSLEYCIFPVASVIVGGISNFAGALLGSSILILSTEALRAFGSARIVLYSLVMAVFILTIREGIFPFITRRYQQFERKVPID